ncbi:hypothetical protein RND71_003127 [Anisodus tanguticus]|uniref:Uncharacterized protein n=1 Tax=Anisodus tanguticus TaxID=243964 RepID=A0AAE1SW36_9SOLA|nr:hypothetical protein RND71_003127 [Anisodus tanguticus]
MLRLVKTLTIPVLGFVISTPGDEIELCTFKIYTDDSSCHSQYSNPTLASAMTDLVPAFTFLIAVIAGSLDPPINALNRFVCCHKRPPKFVRGVTAVVEIDEDLYSTKKGQAPKHRNDQREASADANKNIGEEKGDGEFSNDISLGDATKVADVLDGWIHGNERDRETKKEKELEEATQASPETYSKHRGKKLAYSDSAENGKAYYAERYPKKRKRRPHSMVTRLYKEYESLAEKALFIIMAYQSGMMVHMERIVNSLAEQPQVEHPSIGLAVTKHPRLQK